MPVRFTLDHKGVERLFYEDGHPVQEGLGEDAKAVAAVARVAAPKGKTGKMSRSVQIRRLDRAWGVVANVPYATYVHEGTRGGYPITPHNPPYWLRFYWDKAGKVVYRKRVIHPGIATPQPFLVQALEAVYRR